jgi:4-hydroxy-2-oxoheptanedioate aldolase
MKNRMKQLWKPGKPVINGWLTIPSAFTAEIMSVQGYDTITVDLQHGLIDYQIAISMFQAMKGSPVVPFARVPWLDPAIIMKMLDGGVLGIICPMINTADDARRLASYMRYPPVGERSFGPTRAMFSVGSDYGVIANDLVQCFAMIETAQGFQNLEEIVKVPGINGIYVGPIDLTLGLHGQDLPIGFDREEDEMIDAIKHILSTTHAAGLRAGLHCGTSEYAARAATWGFDLVSVSWDVGLYASAVQENFTKTRRLIDQE